MNLLFCGDIMPGGVLSYQSKYISDLISDYLYSFDFRVATLECAIGTDIPFEPLKLKEYGGNNNVCFARDEDAFRLKELKIDACSLANNHSFDLGKDGLINTIRLLEDNGIAHFGAGMSLKEAAEPFYLPNINSRIAIIGCCIKGTRPNNVIAATANSYGVYQPSIEELIENIQITKRECDFLIIMPHWGEEHVFFPPPMNVKYAKMMIDAGADCIIGSHSHRISSWIRYKGKSVFFGLGNFLYPDFFLTPPRPFYYPAASEEISNMDRCVNYPLSISRPTLSVWGKDSRKGLCVEIAFAGDKPVYKKRLVRLSDENVLYLNNDKSKLSDFISRYILIPLANTLSWLPVYQSLHRGIRFMNRIRLRHLGAFRRRLV